MGTSKSYGGPADRQLLPIWALDQPDADGNDNASNESPPKDEEIEGNKDAADDSAEAANHDEGSEEDLSGSSPPDLTSPSLLWQSARSSFGTAISTGGGKDEYRQAASRYVRARGGSGGAARDARAARIATTRLGGFLSSVSTRGLEATLRTFGLSAVVGKGAGAVFAAILEALAPEGALREEAVARKATAEALEWLYDLYGLEDGDLAKLEKMSGAVVSEAVIESVICYIYRLWLEELSIRIEDGALSAAAAVGLERDVADFVRESVKLDLKGSDVLKIDWEGLEGRGLIDRIYSEAYDLLGAAE
jgi:hypothetical protein